MKSRTSSSATLPNTHKYALTNSVSIEELNQVVRVSEQFSRFENFTAYPALKESAAAAQ